MNDDLLVLFSLENSVESNEMNLLECVGKMGVSFFFFFSLGVPAKASIEHSLIVIVRGPRLLCPSVFISLLANPLSPAIIIIGIFKPPDSFQRRKQTVTLPCLSLSLSLSG